MSNETLNNVFSRAEINPLGHFASEGGSAHGHNYSTATSVLFAEQPYISGQRDEMNHLPVTPLQPAISLSVNNDNMGNIFQARLNELRTTIPPHPIKPLLQRRGEVVVSVKMLQCDDIQMGAIQSVYNENRHFHQIFNSSEPSQSEAQRILDQQGLKIRQLDDLGNGWSIRWSKENSRGSNEKGHSRRILLQW